MTTNPPMGAFTPEAIERGELPPPLDPATPRAAAALALMRDYIKFWNARDAKGIADHIYRIHGRPHGQTELNFRNLLEQTVAEGWDYSTLDDLQVFAWGEQDLLVRGFFSRFAADGRLLPPGPRLTAYVLTEFADGLRVSLVPMAQKPAS